MVRSPAGGTVLEKKVVQGEYVTAGQDLYLLADLSRLWLSVKVYEQELGGIKAGQLAVARFAAFPGRDFAGRVRFVDPVLDPSTRTVGVRVELPNPAGLLKPGMFAAAELRVDLGRGLAIPKSAVLDTGVRQVVYVEVTPGRFAGREVRLGAPAGDRVQVVAGLAAGERVVTSANFLIDSQSQLATGQSDPVERRLRDEALRDEERPEAAMIDRLIEWSLRNRFLVVCVTLLVIALGSSPCAPPGRRHPGPHAKTRSSSSPTGRAAARRRSRTRSPIRSPSTCRGSPGVKTVRATSMFGFSLLTVIFEDKVDNYFARTACSSG